ncbi:methyltransferase domain-containing protein [Halieaceae bacterium IMCC14734]|uniref:Methyltransferase domain-containing protein n=1 Tax=Candidatus Litorirhabdus singularis TaxID=2518993 RepID=A0ABT3THT0_9GAMM|nr:class I SAM-dependent methyltransferase [Candidatus Litorirhabdus singularis]MCX2980942.1 methyltransferase domain-containing protein [Candidatus Litorirhabdus singularis]
METINTPVAAETSCRSCSAPLSRSFVDLGMSPLCESFIGPDQLDSAEAFFPLHALICDSCLLVQLKEYVAPQNIFSEYAYFSSYSDSWVEHARRYCNAMIERFQLGADSLVMEIASNDGYLLQHFVAAGVPCLGIEPAKNVAAVAVAAGIPTQVDFFGSALAVQLAQTPGQPDIIVGNNVLAHVPQLNDFVLGMKTLLAPTGVITLEFPHLLQLMQHNQFDTIYHEHFSYLSLQVVEQCFSRHALTVFDVEELTTHGGSLRVYVRHAQHDALAVTAAVSALREREQQLGLGSLAAYQDFAQQVIETKHKLLSFLIQAKADGKSVVGYGAPGKGNTLLNYCGIRTDFLDYTVDRSPHKQGLFTPGTHIPIKHPDEILRTQPDYVLILPWNLADEICEQMAVIREWGGQFVIPIPEVRVL